MQSSNQPGKISLPFASSGAKQPIPVASQVGIEDGRASYTDGFPPLTRTPLAAGGKPPFGTDMNGILNAVTAVQQWQSAGGLFVYDSAFSTSIGGYPKGAVLASSDRNTIWRSTVENNLSNPDTGGAGWTNPSAGRLLNIAVFTSSGVYTPTPGTNYIEVIVIGGGASGGSASSTSAGQYGAAGGGGGGGCASSRLTSGTSTTSVVVGVGGAAGAGAAGGTSSFGTVIASGGAAGSGSPASTSPVVLAGGAGGTASGGNLFNGRGSQGASGIAFGTLNLTSGSGGSSVLSAGGGGSSSSAPGGNGSPGYGGGGGGASSANGSAAQNGGAGGNGVVIIREYE